MRHNTWGNNNGFMRQSCGMLTWVKYLFQGNGRQYTEYVRKLRSVQFKVDKHKGNKASIVKCILIALRKMLREWRG